MKLIHKKHLKLKPLIHPLINAWYRSYRIDPTLNHTPLIYTPLQSTPLHCSTAPLREGEARELDARSREMAGVGNAEKQKIIMQVQLGRLPMQCLASKCFPVVCALPTPPPPLPRSLQCRRTSREPWRRGTRRWGKWRWGGRSGARQMVGKEGPLQWVCCSSPLLEEQTQVVTEGGQDLVLTGSQAKSNRLN